jgi:hypothetical protein
MNKKKKEIWSRCEYLFAKESIKDMISDEIMFLLDSGYINYSSYDFKKDGYQLMKLINYCVLKKIAEKFKPLDTQFMKQYKPLIKNY